MPEHLASDEKRDWLDKTGLPILLRAGWCALEPMAWGLAVAALISTMLWGTLLDAIWSPRGGVDGNAIAAAVAARETSTAYEEPAGELGIFELWRDHTARAVNSSLNLLDHEPAVTSMMANVGDIPLAMIDAHRHEGGLLAAYHGCWWMLRYHGFFFFLFFGGSLMIWSIAGGAISRIAATRLTRDEKISAADAISFVRPRLWGGYVAAPCIPIVFIAVLTLFLVLGGIVVSIPLIGDIASIFFVIALVLGAVIVVLGLGLLLGGNLLFPAVSVDGADAFDAFSSSVSYVFTRPWKTVMYGVISVIFAAVSWTVVMFIAGMTLRLTRALVSFGTAPFGWWGRGESGDGASKLERVWPMTGLADLHVWPDWTALSWNEYISAVLVGAAVLFVVAFAWSYLASFYYCIATGAYLLLRRDVDETDLGEIYDDETVFGGPDDGRAASDVSEA